MTEKINWHHLFGWTLKDYFFGSNYKVDTEIDLSTKPQQLDVLIIEQTDGQVLTTVPDGLDNLSAHNLLTYKSLREPLDTLTLLELGGHYINYRKRLDFMGWKQLPDDSFRLYAVSTRYPRNLLKQAFKGGFTKRQEGVYDVEVGDHTIRVLALNQMPKQTPNAIWQFFSATPEGFQFGHSHYQWQNPAAKILLNPLYQMYLEEGIVMPLSFEEFRQQYTTAFLSSLTPEEILQRLPTDKVLNSLTLEERLRGLQAAQVVKQFSPQEVVKQFSPQEVVRQFSPQEVLKQFSPKELLTELGLPPEVMAKVLPAINPNHKH